VGTGGALVVRLLRADAGIAERIEDLGVEVGGRLVAAEPGLAPLVAQADGGTPRERCGRIVQAAVDGSQRLGPGIGVGRAFEPEAGPQTTAHILAATKAEAAALQAILRQRILLDAVVVEPATIDVDDAEQRDRGLCRSGAGNGAQCGKSEQGLLHFGYLDDGVKLKDRVRGWRAQPEPPRSFGHWSRSAPKLSALAARAESR